MPFFAAANAVRLVPQPHDGGNGESYDVTGRVTSANGEMRLTSVANMESLLRKVAAESRAVEP